MATTVGSPKPEQQYVDFDEYINYKLNKTRSTIQTIDVLTLLVGTAVVGLGYLLLFVLLDHWFVPGGFGTTARGVMLAGVGTAVAGWLIWKLLLPWFRTVNPLYAARVIEQADPELKSALLTLIDCERAGRPVPAHIRAALERRSALRLSHVDVERAVDHRTLMRLSYILLAVVILFCAYALLSPKKISSSIWRALLPASEVAVATRTEIFDVQPGDTEVLARAHLEVSARIRGATPDRVMLYYTTEDRRVVDEGVQLRPSEDMPQTYAGVIHGERGQGILQNLAYRIEAGDAVTRNYRVTVNKPPSATVEHVSYEYPSYMQLDPLPPQPGGHIDAWEGTSVLVMAKANMPLKSATVIFSDTEDLRAKSEEIPVEITNGTELRAQWKLAFRTDGTYPRYYRIQCRTDDGQRDPEPTLYNIRIRPDLPPDVTLLEPTRDLELPANSIVPLLVTARDPDFLLRYVTLRVEKDGEPLRDEVLFDGRQQSFSARYDFQLKPLNLQPGETITYWIEARDNKQPVGNRRLTTPRLKIHIVEPVSDEEARERFEEEKQRQDRKLDEARRELNEDGAPADDQPQQPGDPTEPEQPGEERRMEEQPGQQPQDQPAAGQEQGADQGEGRGESQQQPGDGQQQRGERGQQGDQTEPGLDDDGRDDGEALRRLFEELQKRDQEQKGRQDQETEPGQQPREGEKPSDRQRDQQQPGDMPEERPDGEPMPGQEDKAGERGEKPDQPTGDPGSDRDGQKPGEPGMNDSQPDGAGEQKPGDGAQPGERTPSAQDRDKPEGDKPAGESGDKSDKPADGPPEGEKTPAAGDKPADGEPAAGEKPGDRDSMPMASDDRADGERGEKAPRDEQSRPEEGRPRPSDRDDPQRRDERDPQRRPMQAPPDGQKPDGTPEGAEGDPMGEERRPGQPGDMKSEEGAPQPSDMPADKPGVRQEQRPGDPDSAPTSRDQRPEEGGTAQKPKDDDGKPADGAPQDGEGTPSDMPSDGRDPAGAKPDGEGQPDGQKRDPSQKPDGEAQQKGEPQGESGDQDGRGGDAKPGGESQPADRPGMRPDGGDAPREGGQHGAGQSPAAPGEDANLEFSKEAANLVLQRLQEQLSRGDVDPALLEELGWNENQMRQFTERLQKHLQTAETDDGTPEAQARQRQFEETLRNLNWQSPGVRGQSREDRVRPGIGTGQRRMPVPPEYREAYEAYTRSLSKKAGESAPAGSGRE